MIQKIFYTDDRGSGKTKWLVDRYIEEREKGNICIYIGSNYKMGHFLDMLREHGVYYTWEVTFTGKEEVCFFTDDLETELGNDRIRYPEKFCAGKWYITMDNEIFAPQSKLC